MRIIDPLTILVVTMTVYSSCMVNAYHRQPCTHAVRSQIQLSDCYIPPMDTSMLLSEASFVLSHDAATGYLRTISPRRPVGQAMSTYAKNQMGTAYDQLNSGARALDLRPKILANGTVIFKHGVDIHVTLDALLEDVVRWCNENDDELVLLLPINVEYQFSTYYDGGSTYVSAMTAAYEKFGINYVHCNDVYGLTVEETMELAALKSGGYVLAIDGQTYSGGTCGKINYVGDQLVTCYSYPQDDSSRVSNVQCTNHKNSEPLASLKEYILSSANNEATDDRSLLGPPANLYDYPFNYIQAIWQVDNHAVTMGIAHASSLLEDNRRSGLNAQLVKWVYEEEFQEISLFAVDNVALHGNALLSVLRNTCGQSTAEECGRNIPPPKLTYLPLSKILFWGTFGLCLFWAGFKLRRKWLKNRNDIETSVDLVYTRYMAPT